MSMPQAVLKQTDFFILTRDPETKMLKDILDKLL